MAKENEKTEGADPQDTVKAENIQALNTLFQMATVPPRQQLATAENAANVLAAALNLKSEEKEEKEESNG